MWMGSKMKLLILVFLVCVQSQANNWNSQSTDEFIQHGDLVSVRIVFGEPIRLFVVGKEEAKFNLADLSVTVRRLKPYPAQIFSTSREGDHFIISNSEELKKTTDLQITTKFKNKSETLKVNINQKR